MAKNDTISCTTCPHVFDEFGNFVECKLLQDGLNHVFVDWFYWNNKSPDNCPLRKAPDLNGANIYEL